MCLYLYKLKTYQFGGLRAIFTLPFFNTLTTNITIFTHNYNTSDTMRIACSSLIFKIYNHIESLKMSYHISVVYFKCIKRLKLSEGRWNKEVCLRLKHWNITLKCGGKRYLNKGLKSKQQIEDLYFVSTSFECSVQSNLNYFCLKTKWCYFV